MKTAMQIVVRMSHFEDLYFRRNGGEEPSAKSWDSHDSVDCHIDFLVVTEPI